MYCGGTWDILKLGHFGKAHLFLKTLGLALDKTTLSTIYSRSNVIISIRCCKSFLQLTVLNISINLQENLARGM